MIIVIIIKKNVYNIMTLFFNNKCLTFAEKKMCPQKCNMILLLYKSAGRSAKIAMAQVSLPPLKKKENRHSPPQTRVYVCACMCNSHVMQWRRRTTTISWRQQERHLREVDGLWHVALMYGLHVVLHLVGPRELLGAHRAREHLALVTLVVEERVPLEAVLVLERLQYIRLGAFQTLVNAFGHGGIPEQVQAADRHLGQLLGRVARRRGPSPDAPLDGRPKCRGGGSDCRGSLLLLLLLLVVVQLLLRLLHLPLLLVESRLQLLLVARRMLGHGQRELGLLIGCHHRPAGRQRQTSVVVVVTISAVRCLVEVKVVFVISPRRQQF